MEEALPEDTQASTNADPIFLTSYTSDPHLITRTELNDLVQYWDLPKTKAQLLGSRLEEWNLLEKGVNFTGKDKHSDVLLLEGDLVYFINVQ